MTEIKSQKPFLEAIQNDELQIKTTAPKFLMACLVAEECENDKENGKKRMPRHAAPLPFEANLYTQITMPNTKRA